MITRAIWKGIICIQDLKIPVNLFNAVREKRIAFNLLHAPDGTRLRQQMVCSHDDQPVPREHQIKGYQFSRGRYVIVTDKMLRQVEPKTSREIEVREFVPSDELDPRFYKHHFYLKPAASRTAYNSLFTALLETASVGISHWAMRRRTFVGALRAGRGGLELSTLKSADEVYGTDELWFRQVAVTEKELRIGAELIENLAAPFHPEHFRNEYRARLWEMIKRKAAGEKIKVVPFPPKEPTREDELVRVLEESIKRVRAS